MDYIQKVARKLLAMEPKNVHEGARFLTEILEADGYSDADEIARKLRYSVMEAVRQMNAEKEK